MEEVIASLLANKTVIAWSASSFPLPSYQMLGNDSLVRTCGYTRISYNTHVVSRSRTARYILFVSSLLSNAKHRAFASQHRAHAPVAIFYYLSASFAAVWEETLEVGWLMGLPAFICRSVNVWIGPIAPSPSLHPISSYFLSLPYVSPFPLF